ncbi:SCAN box domain-containing protein [Trichonephila inaurata madagascariensis]|uniref:SCAN box domain-containing protein n=1 Tax=Trichonephila inaurata madagascariensis TaxID=2747483 RepID=A0A8X6WT47_9ARAC|nr:SCAN box domain-containing protein [Trichonephila inaurata madagascariensis]
MNLSAWRKTFRFAVVGNKPQCDKLKKTPESISHVVTDKSFDELMARYTSLGKVNGVEMKILRDTGATLDLTCNKYVKPHMYTNEKVWLRTPLEKSLICFCSLQKLSWIAKWDM